MSVSFTALNFICLGAGLHGGINFGYSKTIKFTIYSLEEHIGWAMGCRRSSNSLDIKYVRNVGG
jgi:hypothetical protein